MIFRKLILTATLSGLTLSSIAQENNNQTNNYSIQFNIGHAQGEKPKGDFTQQGSMGSSVLYGIEAAYKINEKFSTSFSIDYRGGFSNKYYTTIPQEDYRGESSQRTDIYTLKSKSLVSMLSLYYNIAEINKITPYITIGTGIAKNTTNYNINYNSTELDPAADIVYSKGKKTNLAWKLGLGAKYTMNKNFDLDLRYQYMDLGRITTGETASLNSSTYEDTPAKTGKLKSNEVLLGITYKF